MPIDSVPEAVVIGFGRPPAPGVPLKPSPRIAPVDHALPLLVWVQVFVPSLSERMTE